MVPAYRIGKRTQETAIAFMGDFSERLSNRVQISSDALGAYIAAVEKAFGEGVDYGQIVKFYDAEPIGPGRYGPPRVTGAARTVIAGRPEQAHISTSHVERQNPHDANEHAPIYPADERFQQEAGKLAGGSCLALRALQSRSATQDIARDASDGGWRGGSAMVARGIG